jgi:formylglycine-generating enzyme required for sulfatase activity
MGDAAGDRFATDTERPLHPVTLACAFAIARFPVTTHEYLRFDPAHPSDGAPMLPVVNVSWEDAKGYCAWLSAETGEPFRLPSEAEWEYACRGGTRSPFASGEDISPGEANFLYAEDGSLVGVGGRTPPGRYPANAFGLEDAHGNVCEWVEDAWHPNYRGAPGDGHPWISGGDPGRRVIRGGAWDYLPRLLRSAWRDSLPRGQSRDNVGFRVAMSLEGA